MKKQSILSILLIFLSAGCISAQSTDKTVESINKHYVEIAAKARLCETDDEQGEFGELVMNTLTINSRNHQWRAVGIYGHTLKFFYTGGDTEERMYPDELVVVKSTRRHSDRTYSEEFLFSDKGALMFYFQKAENDGTEPAERRIYFAGLTPIRIIEDGSVRDRLGPKDFKTAKGVSAAAAKIKEIFIRSIRL